MKPIIGVMPLWDDGRDSIWMLPGYLDGIRQAGGLPVIFPFTEDRAEIEQLSALCSGFLFTGGHDISPALYGETAEEGLVSCCEKRDALETAVLDRALGQDKPVFGICRGIQLINAVLGGTLYQDLPRQHPSDTPHCQRPPYHLPAHDVEVLDGTPLRELAMAGHLAVNSYHHQAIRTLAPALRPMAIAPDGLVEAVWRPESRFLWAVQWHPEFAFPADAVSRALFARFIRAAAR